MSIKILMVGDVFADPGLEAFQQFVPMLKQEHKIDFVIVNGENSAKDGRGLTEGAYNSLVKSGANLVTSGNHIWRHEKTAALIFANPETILRPANFPSQAPGKGYSIHLIAGIRIAVVNLMGRVFFREMLDCPFKAAESLLLFLKEKADIILIDFHAEATSEKMALSFYLDGKISGLVGTHTHVQTADNKILPKGSGYITDLGFCGAWYSCIGIEKTTVVNQYLTQMPARYKPELARPYVFSAVLFEFDGVKKSSEPGFEKILLPASLKPIQLLLS